MFKPGSLKTAATSASGWNSAAGPLRLPNGDAVTRHGSAPFHRVIRKTQKRLINWELSWLTKARAFKERFFFLVAKRDIAALSLYGTFMRV